MKLKYFLLFLTLSILLLSCSSLKVDSVHNRSFDFTNFSTYKILKELPTLPDGSQMPSLTYNLIASAIDFEMSKRGVGKNDLFANFGIIWYTSLDEKVYTTGESLSGWQSYFNESDSGMLIIDIIDLENNGVVWRGWAKDVLSSQNLEERINASVSEILSKYPPDNILGLGR